MYFVVSIFIDTQNPSSYTPAILKQCLIDERCEMEKLDLADEKRRLVVVLTQDIREFEQKTGLIVANVKTVRDEHDRIDSVKITVTLPE